MGATKSQLRGSSSAVMSHVALESDDGRRTDKRRDPLARALERA